MVQGVVQGQEIKLVVYDAPGLGEDLRKDPEYIQMYKEKLPACDVVLWVMSARNRAVALDQGYLSQFPEVHERIVFGIGQVDLVEPMVWRSGFPVPTGQQERNILEIAEDRTSRLSAYLGRKAEVIPYSNTHGYNLEGLFTALLAACGGNRSWIFHDLKNFSFEDFIPPSHLQAKRKGVTVSEPKRGTRSQSFLQGLASILGFAPNPEVEEQASRRVGRVPGDERPLSDEEIARLDQQLKEQHRRNLSGDQG
jgi:hypothetical protein